MNGYVTCPDCDGEQILACPSCDGGEDFRATLGCATCGGSGDVPCDECHEGYVYESTRPEPEEQEDYWADPETDQHFDGEYDGYFPGDS